MESSVARYECSEPNVSGSEIDVGCSEMGFEEPGEFG